MSRRKWAKWLKSPSPPSEPGPTLFTCTIPGRWDLGLIGTLVGGISASARLTAHLGKTIGRIGECA